MPIRKELHYDVNQGRLIIWPNPEHYSGGIEVHPDLNSAIAEADRTSASTHQHRYVVAIKDRGDKNLCGYAAFSYADLWLYLGDGMDGEILYKAEGQP